MVHLHHPLHHHPELTHKLTHPPNWSQWEISDMRPLQGGETPKPGSPSPDLLNISNMLICAFQEEPQTLKQALKIADCKKWLTASEGEYKNLIEMGTWKLVSLLHDKKPIKCRWRYVIKANGCFKARLVVKGFTHVQGIDYKETFSYN